VVGSGPGATLDLADASSWAALIVPSPTSGLSSLQGFARALAIWCAAPAAAFVASTPAFARATGGVRITDIAKALYDTDAPATVIESIGSDVLGHWRSMLRQLGEGPRAIVDDPWFSHLFLSPSAGEFPLARPYTRLDLRSPRVPPKAALRIAAVVLDRLLVRQEQQEPTASEVACFILEGGDLDQVLRSELLHAVAESTPSSPDLRLIWIDQLDTVGTKPPDSPPPETSSTTDDDRSLYFMFSTTMDQRHRPAYVKGIMYGYPAFCQFEKPDKFPDDLVFLREVGLILGMSSPLVGLFDDS
jgi:hypothetical protein